MNEYDVAVVGGGPIGSFVAQKIAVTGARVAIFEEHTTIGEPVHCAGLITKRVFDIIACSPPKLVQNKIYGACIHAPSGRTLTFGGDKIHALVINRLRFDETLTCNAQTAGAELLIDHKVVSAKQQDNHVALTIHYGEKIVTVRCKILIGADGSHSTIRKSLGFPHPTEILNGISAELIDTALDPRVVHIFVGNNIAPGFFAWIIPTNTQGTMARIGLAVKTHSKQPLQQYFTILLKHPLLQHATIMKRFGGAIPLGPLKKTVDAHVMLVGDAAAQVKPTSGGGLYPGLLCATHCARIANKALQNNQFTAHFLRQYHIAWSKNIGRELALGMRFRKIFTHLNDEQFTKHIEKLNNQKTIDIINIHGDIDYPSRLALPLLKTSPSLLSLAPFMLRRTKH